jgi:hypothetical protein
MGTTSRRDFLRIAAGVVAGVGIPVSSKAEWKPSERYPDPSIKSLEAKILILY